MCGIVGFFNLERERLASEQLVREMATAIIHRGPDEEGFYFDRNVALGMRRLSIIDLSSGQQPVANEDGSVWLVFNGEIYNFRELRQRLMARGHQFKTQSDTEVIVHLYEDEGDELVQHLNGMFAFALWDKRRERLLIARDRMGEKPLYWTLTKDAFIFASELKSLLVHPSVERKLNLPALRKYLFYECVPSPHSMIAGVYKLPPAHRLVVENGRARTERYWQLDYNVEKSRLSEADAVEELQARLQEAVRLRLVSDVPLGVLLSGGIDSSSIAALACETAQNKIKTFSIGFAEKSFDESPYARAVAQHLGTEHFEHQFTEREMLDLVPTIPHLLDEPLGDASLIPTFLVSSFTRQHVKVALGGDGGDELFAGYPTYVAHRMAGWYGALPSIIRRNVIEPAVAALPVSTDNLSFDFKARRFVRAAALPDGTRNQTWMGSFDEAQQGILLNPEIIAAHPDEEVFKEVRDYDHRNGIDLVERMMTLDAQHYLSECVLVKVDRASMAASLETRAPFLDHTLVEFLTRLPINFKLRGRTTKYILKKVVRGKLPLAVINRPKKGFGMPVAKWLKGELSSLTRDIFSPSRLNQHRLFSEHYISQLLQEHQHELADHRKLLWTLLMFELWAEKTNVSV